MCIWWITIDWGPCQSAICPCYIGSLVFGVQGGHKTFPWHASRIFKFLICNRSGDPASATYDLNKWGNLGALAVRDWVISNTPSAWGTWPRPARTGPMYLQFNSAYISESTKNLSSAAASPENTPYISSESIARYAWSAVVTSALDYNQSCIFKLKGKFKYMSANNLSTII